MSSGISSRVDEEIVFRPQRVAIRFAMREQRSACVCQVSRLGDDRDVAFLAVGERQVRDAFLRSDERNDFAERIEVETKPPLHESRQRPHDIQRDQARIRTGSSSDCARLQQGALQRGRRREIGVAGSQVDYVYSARNELPFLFRKLSERVFGKREKPSRKSWH